MSLHPHWNRMKQVWTYDDNVYQIYQSILCRDVWSYLTLVWFFSQLSGCRILHVSYAAQVRHAPESDNICRILKPTAAGTEVTGHLLYCANTCWKRQYLLTTPDFQHFSCFFQNSFLFLCMLASLEFFTNYQSRENTSVHICLTSQRTDRLNVFAIKVACLRNDADKASWRPINHSIPLFGSDRAWTCNAVQRNSGNQVLSVPSRFVKCTTLTHHIMIYA